MVVMVPSLDGMEWVGLGVGPEVTPACTVVITERDG